MRQISSLATLIFVVILGVGGVDVFPRQLDWFRTNDNIRFTFTTNLMMIVIMNHFPGA